jgi:hypothetical protein
MIKRIFFIISFLIAFTPLYSFARERIVSYVEWNIPDNAPSLICELSNGPEHIMQGQLNCYVNKSTVGGLEKDKKVFTYRDEYRSPISVSPALGPASNALITMWESGAYACYIVFGYNNDKVEKLFEHCSKGGIETIDNGSDGIIFLVTDYVAFEPTDTTIYYWRPGSIKEEKVPYSERLDKAKKLQAGHNIGVQGTAEESRRP